MFGFWRGKGKERAAEPADDAFRDWRASMSRLLEEAREVAPNEATHQKCLFRLQEQAKSPLIVFLSRHLALLDPIYELPDPSPSPHLPVHVHCLPCKRSIASSYTDKGIAICENHMFTDKQFKEVLAHEMLREWDIRRFKVDANDLRHHACVEIRANSLSGGCKLGRELTRSLGWSEWRFARGHPLCVRRQAIAAVAGNTNCPSREEAERVVDEVFMSCYADTRPFDEVYTGP